MSNKFFGAEARVVDNVTANAQEDCFVRMLGEGDSRPPRIRYLPLSSGDEVGCGSPPPPLETIEYALERVLKAFRALDAANGGVHDAIDAPPRRERDSTGRLITEGLREERNADVAKAFSVLNAAAARAALVLEDFGTLAFAALAAAGALLEADTAIRARGVTKGGVS